MSARARAAIVSIGLVAVAASPILRNPSDDGFPLSTYPMFATPRSTSLVLDYALGETRTGDRVRLTPAIVGSREVLQARAILDHAVHGGPRELAATCARIANAVAADDDFADVVAIHIVTGTHDAVDYLVRHVHGREQERTHCAVPR